MSPSLDFTLPIAGATVKLKQKHDKGRATMCAKHAKKA